MGAELLRLLLTSIPRLELTGGHLRAAGGRAPRPRLSAPARAHRPRLPGARRRAARRAWPTSSSSRCRTWSRSGRCRCCARRGRKVIDLSADYRLRDAVALRHVVQGAARRRRRPRGGGVRAARAASQGDRGRLARGLAGLLSRWAPILATAPLLKSGLAPARRHRDRRQVRRDRRGSAGAQGRPDVPLHRGQRERAGLRHRQPPPHGRRSSRSCPRSPGEPVRVSLHAASGARSTAGSSPPPRCRCATR